MGLAKRIPTERLELRRFASDDAPAVLVYSQDPDWAAYQQTTPTTLLEAERVVERLMARSWEDAPAWAIVRSEAVVGLVSLGFTAGHRIALLGYGIHRDHRGLGLTAEAIRAVLAEAFAVHRQLARVAADTDARNLRSARLLLKLGFTHEGTLRSGGVTAAGELVDGALFGLLRSEWEAETSGREVHR